MAKKKTKPERKELRDIERSREKLANSTFGPIKLALMSEAGKFFAKAGSYGLSWEKADMDLLSDMGEKVRGVLQTIANKAQTPKGENDFERLTRDLCDKFALFNRTGIHGMAPSHDLCEMFKHTEITVGAEYFKLPYEIFVIKLSDNALNFDYVILNMGPNDEHLQFFFANKGFFNTIGGSATQHATYLTEFFPLAFHAKLKDMSDNLRILMDGKESDLENVFSTKVMKMNLQFDEGHEIFEDLVIDLIRISINCVLYLNSRKPEETVVRKETPAKNKPVLRPDIEMNEYGFVQQIKIKTVNKVYGEDGEAVPSGTIMTPHWRRGHWRTQHHGEGNKLTKQVFIQPVFINPSYFKGDKSDTGVSYKA